MKTLSKRQVLLLHSSLIEAFGGSDGVRDEGLLESALATPFQTFDGEPVYPSVQSKAAQHITYKKNRSKYHCFYFLVGLPNPKFQIV